jgi:hypothetical protein
VPAQNIPRNIAGWPGEAAGMQAPVNGRAHVANDVGPHDWLSSG